MTKEDLSVKLKEAIAVVTFENVDRNIRVMKCTLLAEHLPIHEGFSKKPINENVMTVWDLDNNAWRSFRIDSIKSVSFSA